MMSEGLSIFYASDGKVWAEYLQDKLSSEEYGIATLLKDFERADHRTQTRVNIFMITPDLTDLDNWDVMKHFDGATSVAVLTGINHDDWDFAVEKFKNDSLIEWFAYELLAEEDCVRKLIVFIISLYEGVHAEPEEDDVYVNILSDTRIGEDTETVALPEKQKTTSENTTRNLESVSNHINQIDESFDSIKTLTEEDNRMTLTDEIDGTSESDKDIYKTFTCSRPVNTVSHIFRKVNDPYRSKTVPIYTQLRKAQASLHN